MSTRKRNVKSTVKESVTNAVVHRDERHFS
jgi:hypothetical protein